MIMLQRLVTDTLIVILVFLLPITVQLMMSMILINYNDHGVRISGSGSISGISGISRAFADSSSGYGNGRQLETLNYCTIEEENVNGPTIVGTLEDDVCIGTDHSETILLFAGDDKAYAEGGDDIVMGGANDDIIVGNGGEDLLNGNFGDDKIDGGGRNDILIGAENDDILSGEDGDDTLFGETGNDILKGGHGADKFICGPLIDTVLDYTPSQGDTLSNDCEIVNTIQ
jgi:Ca2+-binding RTX toxin-like protein